MNSMSKIVVSIVLSIVMVVAVGCASDYAAKKPHDHATIMETIENTESFSTLEQAIDQAGLTETLQTGGPFTVLVPANKAFEDMRQDELAKLLEPDQKEMLASVLKYHVLDKSLSYDELVQLRGLKMLNGEMIQLYKRPGGAFGKPNLVINNNVHIVQRDIHCNNGTIHVIDAVLLP